MQLISILLTVFVVQNLRRKHCIFRFLLHLIDCLLFNMDILITLMAARRNVLH